MATAARRNPPLSIGEVYHECTLRT
jgi:hypothetical protein